MMRALAERHRRPSAARHGRGHLARHHRDLHLRPGAVTPSTRTSRAATRRCATRPASISASRCPTVTAPERRGGDRGRGRVRAAISASSASTRAPRRAPGGGRSPAPDGPKIIARLPFIERPGHPAGTPVFVISKPLADAAVRDVVLYAAQFERWREGASEALAGLGGEVDGERRRRHAASPCSSPPRAASPPRDAAGGARRSLARSAASPSVAEESASHAGDVSASK